MAFADGRERVDEYLRRKGGELGDIAQGLRRLMKTTVPGVKETVNSWKLPTFESNGPMCYFSVGNDHVAFGFCAALPCRTRQSFSKLREKPSAT
jgi:hypothetical protein